MNISSPRARRRKEERPWQRDKHRMMAGRCFDSGPGTMFTSGHGNGYTQIVKFEVISGSVLIDLLIRL